MKKPYTTLVVTVAVLLIGGACVLGIVSEHVNETTRSCTVLDKDRTTNRDGVSDARIYTKDCGTLQVTDLITRGQLDSSDIFAAIQPGHTYQVTTVGWRLPFASRFPTIVGTPAEVNQ